ncbi:hypothetical protein [Streptomyces cellulosae]|uniref:hypothetical protein n=1 Tax=Streptomyces cellulosae TaxID=1968 RepID=UPI0004C497D0|nr:hypothetical protein [Streptomyces cellulosae]
MPQVSKVELYAAIRRDHRAGIQMRELERKYNISWRTVKKAVDSAIYCGSCEYVSAITQLPECGSAVRA